MTSGKKPLLPPNTWDTFQDKGGLIYAPPREVSNRLLELLWDGAITLELRGLTGESLVFPTEHFRSAIAGTGADGCPSPGSN